jgi:hypothetical protein
LSAYQGELIGESVFHELANRSMVSDQKAKLRAIADVERHTGWRLKPIAERLGIEASDAQRLRVIERRVSELESLAWPEFIDKALRDWPPYIARFEALKRERGKHSSPSTAVKRSLDSSFGSCGTAVHVHFLQYGPGGFNRNHDGRKEPRNACGRDQHLSEQLERLRAAVHGNRPHVPDHGALAIKVGRCDQKKPALGGLHCDGLQHLLSRVVIHEIGKGLASKDA